MAKGPQAFRTISEAADEVGVAQHVLRFWETKFSFLRPMKRAGGRRFYRPQDIDQLKAVRALLHGRALTIKDVQALHKDGGLKGVLALAQAAPTPPPAAAMPDSTPIPTGTEEAALTRLAEILREAVAAKARLDALLYPEE